jgi:hypothetical protein
MDRSREAGRPRSMHLRLRCRQWSALPAFGVRNAGMRARDLRKGIQSIVIQRRLRSAELLTIRWFGGIL